MNAKAADKVGMTGLTQLGAGLVAPVTSKAGPDKKLQGLEQQRR